MLYRYLMLSRLGRLNNCLNPCLIQIVLVVAPKYHRVVLGKENAREVRRPLQFLHPSGCLRLTVSQLYCPWYGKFTSMTKISNFPERNNIKLPQLAELVVVVVLCPSSNPVFVNCMLICILTLYYSIWTASLTSNSPLSFYRVE